MKSFRNPKYVERYENVVFDLETALITNIANNAHQKKKINIDLCSLAKGQRQKLAKAYANNSTITIRLSKNELMLTKT